MFPLERNHPRRYAQVSAPRFWPKGPSTTGLVVIYRPSRRGWHPFIQLRNLSVGLQPEPQVLSVERTRSPRGSCAVTTPRPGCNASRRACCGQAQDLACSLILFRAGNIIAGLLTERASRLSYWSRDVDGACDGSLFSGSRISWFRTVWIQEPQSLMSQRGLNSSIRTKRMLDQRQ